MTTLVTIVTSVPVTTLSMLSTSFETRFMISPVFVPGEERERHPVQMRDEARADVAHDAFADERVQVALHHTEPHREERCTKNDGNVDTKLTKAMMRDSIVDDIRRHQSQEQPKEGRNDDARKNKRLLLPVRRKQTANPRPFNVLRTLGLSGEYMFDHMSGGHHPSFGRRSTLGSAPPTSWGPRAMGRVSRIRWP